MLLTEKKSIRYPTVGLASTYMIGSTDIIRPIISGPIPSCFPKTFICGKMGPIAANKVKFTKIHINFQTVAHNLPAMKKK